MTARDPYADFAAYGEVRKPADAPAPILGPATREVLHQWLYELNYADELARVGVAPRRRVLLKGPPGTGKTTLAHHVAGRLGVPLVVVETPSLVSKYVGQTGEQIGKLFRTARAYGDNIAIFLDELDAVAHSRTDGATSAAVEKNNVVVALLQMMDRHKGLVFAATNRPQGIDAAVWRRFQLQIDVGLPGALERFAIVKHYLAPYSADDATVGTISAAMAGAAPALVREVCETIKRDLVLGPRLRQDTAPAALFGRIAAAIAPAEDMPTPPLWSDDALETIETLAAMPWPPVLEPA